MACRILVPQLGIERLPPAMEVQTPNHWTNRKFPQMYFLTPAFLNHGCMLESLEQLFIFKLLFFFYL